MFSFQCPGCRTVHYANEEFQGIRGKCLRCGEVLFVGERTAAHGPVQPSGRRAAPTRRPAPAPKRAKLATSAAQGSDDATSIDLSEAETLDPLPPAEPESDVVELTDNEVAVGSSAPPDDDENGFTPRPSPPITATTSSWFAWRESIRALIKPALALALIGGGVWYYFATTTPDRIEAPKDIPTTSDKVGLAPAQDPPPPKSETDNDERPPAKAPKSATAPAKSPAANPPDPIRVSVQRLQQSIGGQGIGFGREFEGKLVEIRGSYLRTAGNSLGLRVVFAMAKDADPLVLTVSPPSLETKLANLRPGQMVTLRGVFQVPGKLNDAEVVRTQSPGDDLYCGKELEIMGLIADMAAPDSNEAFGLRFEPDATDSRISVDCHFKKQQRGQLEDWPRGQFVIVRGRCGLQLFNTVQLHDCQILYDYRPMPGIPRLEQGSFAQPYDVEMREDEPKDDADGPAAVSAVQLLDAFADPAEGAKRFGKRWVEVEGTVDTVDPHRSAVIIEGGTDQRLRVMCRFNLARFKKLNNAARMKIQGFCNGKDGVFVRLDNCTALEPAPRPEHKGARLDVAYLPFRPSNPMTYDAAHFLGTPQATAVRQILSFKDLARLEFATTQVGPLRNKNSLAGGVNWNKKSPGGAPSLHYYRLHGGRIEISPAARAEPTKPAGVWEPVINVGSQVGDTWKWRRGDQISEYTVTQLSGFDNSLAAVVVKKTTETSKTLLGTESVHTYVRDVGEVDRKLYEIPVKGPKKLVMEMTLVK